jgi:hypothetical protein
VFIEKTLLDFEVLRFVLVGEILGVGIEGKGVERRVGRGLLVWGGLRSDVLSQEFLLGRVLGLGYERAYAVIVACESVEGALVASVGDTREERVYTLQTFPRDRTTWQEASLGVISGGRDILRR